MSWGHVKPTQRGKPKTTKRQAQHGVEGGAPHRAEAFAAIQYEDAGKKATHHLQTSEQKTGDQADRPDARTVAEATRYPNGDNRGKPSEPLISPREGGQRGGQPQESTKQPKNHQDKHQDQTQRQTNQKRGKRANPPANEATNRTRDTTTTGQRPGTAKMSVEWEGLDDIPQRATQN